ncbi:MAG: glycosyltransferase family 2 protein [Saprospiraceae bacterium]|nr:glycosyltransferase family 2 protein [Saprospiraceae bacterium]MCF8249229.1 glycosyltransferase family 2 protein [Saprospiraceae bacterium]MCF8280164.1 glycosyltransferase family 2 protein [Bacteroidales bacterium]MCF8311358.1 glycosyltransferase family 2 protein [Saprospiraceae bacterium]MCF8442979.1 glycosyltransferase family 2 protein [Saprospiraceae bacterium]
MAHHTSYLNPHTSITAVVISQNEARTIGQCVAALRKVCDEVLVLDSASTDGTIEICEKLGAKVLQQEWLGYSQTKNVGNEMASNDWILSIDSDEVLSEELIESLKNLQPETGKVYALDRITEYEGKWVRHSGWYPEWKVRLFDRHSVEWQGDFVHETLHIPADYQVVRLQGKLFHYSFKNTEDHLLRLVKYARLGAAEQFAKGKKVTFVKRWFAPAARFVRGFFIKRGFLDGRIGWLICKREAAMVRLRYKLLEELWRNQGA